LFAYIFENLVPSWYWSGAGCVVDPAYAWIFLMLGGYQFTASKSNYCYNGLAVHSGNVSVAPVPEPLMGGSANQLWLFSSFIPILHYRENLYPFLD
jgi:hypothetical protein